MPIKYHMPKCDPAIASNLDGDASAVPLTRMVNAKLRERVRQQTEARINEMFSGPQHVIDADGERIPLSARDFGYFPGYYP